MKDTSDPFLKRGSVDPVAYARWGSGLEHHRWAKTLGVSSRGERVLDFGCGQGAYVEALAKAGRRGFGVDTHEYAEWKKRTDQARVSQSDWFARIEESVPFPDGYFDVILCFEVLEHCLNPQAVLGELRRAGKRDLLLSIPDCSPGGLLSSFSLACAHWTDLTHVNFFTADSISRLLGECGWELVCRDVAYRVPLNACFWEHVRWPTIIRKWARTLFDRMNWVQEPYSAVLVHARKA